MPNSTTIRAGQRFGRGVVIGTGIRTGTRRQLGAVLLCSCGQYYAVTNTNLARQKSCGCMHRDRMRELQSTRLRLGLPASRTTHGLSHHPLFSTWRGMLQRCENPKAQNYRNYGGRGIRVCDRWHDVAAFIPDIERWLGPRPEGMTLDRIQNDHDYRLDNVRWATKSEQRRKQRPTGRPVT